jgi:hypothetical protein
VNYWNIAGFRREVEALATRSAQLTDEVPARLIRPDVREAAELWADVAALSLGLKFIPRVRWLPLERRDIRGLVEPDAPTVVWIRPQDQLADVVETAAHETRHCWQLQPDALRWTQKGLDTLEGRERDAHEFGLMIRACFVEKKTVPLAYATGAAPRTAPVAVHAQRANTPRPETKHIYRMDGRAFADCLDCEAAVPVGASHRCRQTYR